MSIWATARNSQYFHPQGGTRAARPRNLVRETLQSLSPGDDWQADSKAPHETRVEIMALFANAGLSRIGFVRDPVLARQP